MKVTFKDLAVGILGVLGVVSSISWLDIPFWVYLVVIVAYGGLRLADKDSNEI
jgi:hypothetical protein